MFAISRMPHKHELNTRFQIMKNTRRKMEHRLLHRIHMKFFTRYVFALNLQSKTYRRRLRKRKLKPCLSKQFLNK